MNTEYYTASHLCKLDYTNIFDFSLDIIMKAGEIVIYLNGQGIDKYTIYTSDEIPVDILNSLEYLRGRIEDLTGHRLTISY